MEDAKARTRRRHDKELKQRVLAECAVPGASVAAIAMAHDLNANLVHRWRRLAGGGQRVGSASFVPVTVATIPSPAALGESCESLQAIDIELRRGATIVKVRWPMAGAASCAAWLRELLR